MCAASFLYDPDVADEPFGPAIRQGDETGRWRPKQPTSNYRTHRSLFHTTTYLNPSNTWILARTNFNSLNGFHVHWLSDGVKIAHTMENATRWCVICSDPFKPSRNHSKKVLGGFGRFWEVPKMASQLIPKKIRGKTPSQVHVGSRFGSLGVLGGHIGK